MIFFKKKRNRDIVLRSLIFKQKTWRTLWSTLKVFIGISITCKLFTVHKRIKNRQHIRQDSPILRVQDMGISSVVLKFVRKSRVLAANTSGRKIYRFLPNKRAIVTSGLAQERNLWCRKTLFWALQHMHEQHVSAVLVFSRRSKRSNKRAQTWYTAYPLTPPTSMAITSFRTLRLVAKKNMPKYLYPS